MFSKPNILHQWSEPKDIRLIASNSLLKAGKWQLCRTLLFIAFLELALYLFFSNVAPDELDINWERIFITVFVAAVLMSSFFFILAPLIIRYSTPKYQITEKNISRSDLLNQWNIPFSKIDSFWLYTNEEFPDLISVRINSKKLPPKSFLLPKDETAQQIIETLNQYILQIEPPATEKRDVLNTSPKTFVYYWIFTAIYSALAAYYIAEYGKVAYLVIIFSTLIIGPGTFCSIHLKGIRFYKDKQTYGLAYVFNFIAMITILLLFFLIKFYQLSKQIQ